MAYEKWKRYVTTYKGKKRSRKKPGMPYSFVRREELSNGNIPWCANLRRNGGGGGGGKRDKGEGKNRKGKDRMTYPHSLLKGGGGIEGARRRGKGGTRQKTISK